MFAQPVQSTKSPKRQKVLAALLICLSGCARESEPAASEVSWAVQPSAPGKGYQLIGGAILNGGLSGWYQPTAVLVDSRGCQTDVDLPAIQIAGRKGAKTAKFDGQAKTGNPVATAELRIAYMEAPIGSLDPRSISQTVVYQDRKVVDGKIRVPSSSDAVCATKHRNTKASLRERAATDAEGADAAAIDKMSRAEVVATSMNSAGFLCARVLDMYPVGANIIARCIEYRNGTGRVKYRVDAEAGTVEKLD